MVIRTANDGEIQQAEVASARVTDVKVREFAAMMTREHSAANDRATALFRERNLVPAESGVSNRLRSASFGETQTLATLGGTQLDRAYVESQVRMHRDLLRMIDDTLYPTANDQYLRDHLTDMRAHVAAHLAQAESLSRGLPR